MLSEAAPSKSMDITGGRGGRRRKGNEAGRSQKTAEKKLPLTNDTSESSSDDDIPILRVVVAHLIYKSHQSLIKPVYSATPNRRYNWWLVAKNIYISLLVGTVPELFMFGAYWMSLGEEWLLRLRFLSAKSILFWQTWTLTKLLLYIDFPSKKKQKKRIGWLNFKILWQWGCKILELKVVVCFSRTRIHMRSKA